MVLISWNDMLKSSFLFTLTLCLLCEVSFCQLRVNALGYVYPIDSTEIARFKEASKEFNNFYRHGAYRKTKEILPYGFFIGKKLNHLPPPHNFSGLFISTTGAIFPTTKVLVDSLFMKAFSNSSFRINYDEIVFYYMLFTRSGYVVNLSTDLSGFSKSEKVEFDLYQKEKAHLNQDSSNLSPRILYSYNKSYRTIYEYRFYIDDDGNWLKPPDKIILFEEVGPLNYWR